MNAWLNSSDSLWHLAGWTMIHFLWIGSLVAGLGGLLRFVCRRSSPNVRYATSLASLLALGVSPLVIAAALTQLSTPASQLQPRALPGGPPAIGLTATAPQAPGRSPGLQLPGAPLPTGVSPVGLPPVVVDLARTVPPSASSAPEAAPTAPPSVASGPQAAPAVPIKAAPRPVEADSPPWLALNAAAGYLPWLWLAGSPLTFCLLALGLVGSARLRRSCTPLTSGPVYDACHRLRGAMRITRQVSLAVCESIAQPVLIGIARPLILLPASALSGWTPEELEMVLLHELAHVRRWDNLVNLLQRVVESLLFFHPAVWLVSRQVRRDREECCDAAVVRHTARPEQYAELLVSIAATLRRGQAPSLALASAMADHPLAGRIRRILKLPEEPMGVSPRTLAVMLALPLVLVAATVYTAYADDDSTPSRSKEAARGKIEITKIGNEKTTGRKQENADKQDNVSTRVYPVADIGPVMLERWAKLISTPRTEIQWFDENKSLVVTATTEGHRQVARFIADARGVAVAERRVNAAGRHVDLMTQSADARLTVLLDTIEETRRKLAAARQTRDELERLKQLAIEKPTSPEAIDLLITSALERESTHQTLAAQYDALKQQLDQRLAAGADRNNEAILRLEALVEETQQQANQHRAEWEDALRKQLAATDRATLQNAVQEEYERRANTAIHNIKVLQDALMEAVTELRELEVPPPPSAVHSPSAAIDELTSAAQAEARRMADSPAAREMRIYDVEDLTHGGQPISDLLEGLQKDPLGPRLDFDWNWAERDKRLRISASPEVHQTLARGFEEMRQRAAAEPVDPRWGAPAADPPLQAQQTPVAPQPALTSPPPLDPFPKPTPADANQPAVATTEEIPAPFAEERANLARNISQLEADIAQKKSELAAITAAKVKAIEGAGSTAELDRMVKQELAADAEYRVKQKLVASLEERLANVSQSDTQSAEIETLRRELTEAQADLSLYVTETELALRERLRKFPNEELRQTIEQHNERLREVKDSLQGLEKGLAQLEERRAIVTTAANLEQARAKHIANVFMMQLGPETSLSYITGLTERLEKAGHKVALRKVDHDRYELRVSYAKEDEAAKSGSAPPQADPPPQVVDRPPVDAPAQTPADDAHADAQPSPYSAPSDAIEPSQQADRMMACVYSIDPARLDAAEALMDAANRQFYPIESFTLDGNAATLTIVAPEQVQLQMRAALAEAGLIPATSPPPAKFPSLEEQKIIDRAYRMLGLELEAIDKDDLDLVRQLGHAGGLKSVARNMTGINDGDILVGLHVWPVTDLKSLDAILSRDDLAELVPLKYYAVRSVNGQPSLRTGRIDVDVASAALPSPPSDPAAETQERRLQPGDAVRIHAAHASSDAPLNGQFVVEPAGTVPLGPVYGRVAIGGLTVLEAEAAVEKHLSEILQNPETQLTLAAEEWKPAVDADGKPSLVSKDPVTGAEKSVDLPLVQAAPPDRPPTISPGHVLNIHVDGVYPEQPIKGEYRVEPQGTLPLGPSYGRVKVVGLTVLDAEEVLKKHLHDLLDDVLVDSDPEVQITFAAPPAMLYDGKTFDQWRESWQAELNVDRRLEAVQALAAFARAGLGREAAAAIFDVAGQYDFGDMTRGHNLFAPSADGLQSERKLKSGVINLLATGQAQVRAADWLPELLERLAANPAKWQSLYEALLYQMRNNGSLSYDASATPHLLEAARDAKYGVQAATLATLAVKKLDEPSTAEVDQRIGEMLAGDNTAEAVKLLNLIGFHKSTFDRPEAIALLLHDDPEISRAARTALIQSDINARPSVAQKLLAVLDDPEKSAQHADALRALAVLNGFGRLRESEFGTELVDRMVKLLNEGRTELIAPALTVLGAPEDIKEIPAFRSLPDTLTPKRLDEVSKALERHVEEWENLWSRPEPAAGGAGFGGAGDPPGTGSGMF